MYIHIVGPPGVGKTTFVNKIKQQFKNKVITADSDDIYDKIINDFIKNNPKYVQLLKNCEFEHSEALISKEEEKEYERLHKLAIKEKKPLIISGHGFKYNGITFTHKFGIKAPYEQIIRQQNLRELEKVKKGYNIIKKIIEKQNLCLVDTLIRKDSHVFFPVGPIDLETSIKSINAIYKGYEDRGYKFYLSSDLFKKVSELINNFYS